MFIYNFLYFSLYSLPHVLLLDTTEKSLSLSSLCLPSNIYKHLQDSNSP